MEIKKALPKYQVESVWRQQHQEEEPCKIFVGGLHIDVTDDALKELFSKYGEVRETLIMIDRVTGKPRGFAFVTFNNSSSVDRVINTPEPIEFYGKKVLFHPSVLKKVRPG